MSKKEKLIKRLKSKPRDFTFEEVESLLSSLGFKKSNSGRASGSRVEFVRGNIKLKFHKPHGSKPLLLYQLLDILNELESEGLI